jgi:3-deoxy-D-manno-octulosonate 8-phosphate phosphatase (KDO 8-P phosphatase)
VLELTSEVASRIRLIVLDVDGVLTDGRIVLAPDGRELMSFCARDGIGIKFAQFAGLEVVFLSARAPSIVKVRAEMLGVADVRLGHERKLPVVRDIADGRGLSLDEVTYLGDDLVDIEPVAAVGVGVAVADACRDLKERAPFVTEANGGAGAVRELVEAILRGRGIWEETIRSYFENA